MNYKILVLDLDGTLTNSKKELTSQTRKKLIEAQEKGVKIVLASGRPTYGIVPLAEAIDLEKYEGYILSFNGAQIINWKTKEIIYKNELLKDRIPALYDATKDTDVEILSYYNEYIISETEDNKYIQHESYLNKMQIKKVESFTSFVNYNVPKCLIVGNEKHIIKLEKEMKQKFCEEMSIYRSEPFFLELMPLNVDKAISLKRLLKHLSIDKSEMVACGDGYNDLSMIELAGLGIAMENAQPAVKEIADYITLSNDCDGVAAAIDKFLLQK